MLVGTEAGVIVVELGFTDLQHILMSYGVQTFI